MQRSSISILRTVWLSLRITRTIASMGFENEAVAVTLIVWMTLEFSRQHLHNFILLGDNLDSPQNKKKKKESQFCNWCYSSRTSQSCSIHTTHLWFSTCLFSPDISDRCYFEVTELHTLSIECYDQKNSICNVINQNSISVHEDTMVQRFCFFLGGGWCSLHSSQWSKGDGHPVLVSGNAIAKTTMRSVLPVQFVLELEMTNCPNYWLTWARFRVRTEQYIVVNRTFFIISLYTVFVNVMAIRDYFSKVEPKTWHFSHIKNVHVKT